MDNCLLTFMDTILSQLQYKSKNFLYENERMKGENSVMDTNKLIDQTGMVSIPMKFKLHQKVYHPRITQSRKLLDIREYYIVRINITIDGRFTSIDYHASPNKDNVRGKLFYEGRQLFHTYEEALEYAKEQGCKTTI